MLKGNEPVVTYAMALDFRKMLTYKNKHPQLQRLFIKNIESFYNFKTLKVGNHITIATSVLSNSANSTDIDKMEFDEIRPVYDVQDENILDEEDLKLSIQTQREKRDRISFVFDHVKKTLTSQEKPTDTPVLNYFALNARLL